MCGRFAFAVSRARVLRRLREDYPDLDLDNEWVDEGDFHPRYNIAPRTRSVVIRRRNTGEERTRVAAETATEGKENTSENVSVKQNILHTMKWGLVPHWSKHEDTSLNTINAKGENLVDGGGMWGSLKGKKRCVVACQGYYEWLKKGKDKVPHFTKHKDGRIMLLAGLYDSVVLEGTSETLWTFTIVTTDANKQLSWLHDRMPLVLSTSAQLSSWLDTSSQEWTPRLAKLIRPYSLPLSRGSGKSKDTSGTGLECYAVPVEVGKVGEESSTFIEPVSKRKDGIEAMFQKQKQKQALKDTEISKTDKSEERMGEEVNGSSETKKGTRDNLEHHQKRCRSSSVEIIEEPPTKKRHSEGQSKSKV